ncbi:MAG: Transcriptional regulator, LysR family [uncultured Solirubrobacteraceae bacterium]|uniref:Transcriptional regulator, LysR family n=1 Tax=uncultured Solirubrobacteraceae bacterium TaxID=1162706 RepID=A0A6J4S9Y7_9ACTN|nr:MAG: Transcriptional regulator, LysR family [uncultured Solirubrobacteraceae bacterium]
MLDPRLLRSFVVLAEELHFTRAAERLHLAQPALSQQLRRLEQQVGTELLERSSRAVALTDAGRAMLEPARSAVRATEQAERAVREAARTTAQPLKVGVDLYIDDVVATLAEYASQHPEVSLWISRMHEMQGQELLAAGQIDAFIGFTPPVAPEQGGRVRALDVELCALVGPDAPGVHGPVISLPDLRRSPIVTPAREQSPTRFDFFMDLLSEGQGAEALSLREIDALGPLGKMTIVEEIRTGGAVGFGPPETLAAFAEELRVLSFAPPVIVSSWVSWTPGHSRLVDAFVDHFSTAHQALATATRAVPSA